MNVPCLRIKSPFAMFLVLVIVSYWSEYSQAQIYLPPPSVETTAITYKTEDGWTIRGTLVLPKNPKRLPVPGVVLLTEPVNRIRTTYSSTLEDMLPKEDIAVLLVDVRGTAGSYAPEGKRDFVKFTPAELDDLQLDIKGAVKFLASQKIVDDERIGLVGSGLTAHYSIVEAYENPAVQAVVSIVTTKLGEKARQYLTCDEYCANYEGQRRVLPILTIVGSDQPKRNQRIELEPYYLSEHPNSHLLFGVQRGTNMLNRPTGLREATTEWLVENLKALPTETEVTFKSSDGWTLHGTLFMPGVMPENENVPGVVFAHGYNHTSESMYNIARHVASNGIAAFTLDWRGTRKSADPKRGEVGINLANEDRDQISLDIKAAVNQLASQQGVDANRLGLFTATAVNNHTVRAAMGDPRIKTMIGLSFYAPDDDVKEYLQTSEMPLLIVASTEDVNADGGSLASGSREVYQASRSKDTQLIMFDNAGRGTGMMKTNPELRGMFVRWFQEKLAN